MTKKTNSSQKIDYSYMTAPRTAEDDAVDAELASGDAPDPSIQYNAANQLNALNNHIDNKFGANYAPETAAAMRYAGANTIRQNQSQMATADAYQRKQAKFGKLMALRNARAPQLTQTGGTSTGGANAADFWNGLFGGVLSSI